MAKKTVARSRYNAIWMRWQRSQSRLLRLKKLLSEFDYKAAKILRDVDSKK